ncbi:hypothetical protein ANTQUA_LOCUS8633 [Anthophora quadrimaculata]
MLAGDGRKIRGFHNFRGSLERGEGGNAKFIQNRVLCEFIRNKYINTDGGGFVEKSRNLRVSNQSMVKSRDRCSKVQQKKSNKKKEKPQRRCRKLK